MTYLQDFFSLLTGCLGLFAEKSTGDFALTLGVGLLLAAFCWWTCSQFSRLWNLGFRVTLKHHLLCLLAALLTLAFTVTWVALRYSNEAAAVSVKAWEVQVNADEIWADATYARAWEKVKASGLEDFTNVPAPSQKKSHIPTTKDGSRRLAASVYARAAIEHFATSRPFLSKILAAKVEVPQAKMDADMNGYFASGQEHYPPSRAIALVAKEIKQQLDTQLPRVVAYFRGLCIALFILVQVVPFGLVAVAAYRDLRVRTTYAPARSSV